MKRYYSLKFLKELAGTPDAGRRTRFSPFTNADLLIRKYRPISVTQSPFRDNDRHRALSCASWQIVLNASPTNSGSSATSAHPAESLPGACASACNRHALLLPADERHRIAGLFTGQPDFG
ncbi:hypothetical protein KCP78_08855 [Salmonella enterica subsp. enterica]|nr:hypothetical protein KCP78_08855 [Salmonella enterica subsp. enterica]